MEDAKKEFHTIDEYISQYPTDLQEKLQALRQLIKETAPDAKEKISWAMPTFDLYGNLIHFAAFKNHIGIYPGPSGVEVFQEKLTEYKSSKGAIQFPNNKPLPFEIIKEIIQYRVQENLQMEESKAEKKAEKKAASKTLNQNS